MSSTFISSDIAELSRPLTANKPITWYANASNDIAKDIPMSEETKQQPEWLSTTDAAEIMGVAVSNVRYLCTNGRIECVKYGRNWLVSREAAENYQRSKRDPKWLNSDNNSD